MESWPNASLHENIKSCRLRLPTSVADFGSSHDIPPPRRRRCLKVSPSKVTRNIGFCVVLACNLWWKSFIIHQPYVWLTRFEKKTSAPTYTPQDHSYLCQGYGACHLLATTDVCLSSTNAFCYTSANKRTDIHRQNHSSLYKGYSA